MQTKDKDWALTRLEKTTERYIEAEQFIVGLKWWERLFCSRKINRFIKSRLDKYNF